MWIVRLALRRPYTFIVASALVLILGILAILRMPTDIFPNVNIPVIAIAFNYSGMPADEMEKRVVGQFERILTTTVNDIEHIESQSLSGVGVVKVYFQPSAKIEEATAQVTAIAQTTLRQMPPGMQPPLIIRYSASNVPVLQLAISSDTLPEQALFDMAFNQVRTNFITIPGVQIPYPYGGKQRQVMVDLDPEKLYAYGISPADVSNAVNLQSVILPAGTAKIDKREMPVRLNGSPINVAALNDLPIKTVNGTTVYIRDVANVRDGFQPQTNKVNTNGKPGVLMSILKNGNASTLSVVDGVLAAIPGALAKLPPDVRQHIQITPMFDQSVFVRASVQGVVKEAAIAAGLTGLMILLFLGSWRSTLIVVISIPLSILVSIIILALLGETLNTMTLGGMALAVGILVDDATVAIENIHRNLHQRKRLVQAILDGSQEIAVPAFVSTLAICIVFAPVAFITGAAKYLFTPLSMAVVFAMMTSYILSRTLVPTLVHYLLAAEVDRYGGQADPEDPDAQVGARRARRWHRSTALHISAMVLAALVAVVVTAIQPLRAWTVSHGRTLIEIALVIGLIGGLLVLIARFNLIWRAHDLFNAGFEKFRRWYGALLAWALDHRVAVTCGFALLVITSLALSPATSLLGAQSPLIGQDFFPSVDAGQLRLHVRAPAGTRLEETEKYFADVESVIREIVPAGEIKAIIDNIGIPNSSINLSLSDGSLMSAADGEILVSLSENHKPSEVYQQKLRLELAKRFPQLVCFFAPSDIASQVLNFGLAAPIDVQISGPAANAERNLALAGKVMADIRAVRGAVDARMQQVSNTPDVQIDVDRTMADQIGLTQREVAGDLLVSLSSSAQTAPNFFLNRQNAVNYNIMVMTPQHRMTSINALQNTPIVPAVMRNGQSEVQLLGNLATVGRGVTPTNVTHYNIFPTADVLLGVQGTDLASVQKAILGIIGKYRPQLPPGSNITLRGQVESKDASFQGLGFGLVFAVVLVYLLMVINFQSWIDPLIILMALPGALAGILWMLFATGTNISVPALMGAIMSIGVATANSILMITFANDQRKLGIDAHRAALAAGLTRLRPVVMTALAMIIGMLPMSLGFGEGGEQNAPLGRAVIGGLTLATFTTLLFVPVVYSALRKAPPKMKLEPELQ
jgi:multidrug efflux pump subunit AcrB